MIGKFNSLKRLEFFGGDFFSDGMNTMFYQIGQRLTKLDLHHVDGIDIQAVAVLLH